MISCELVEVVWKGKIRHGGCNVAIPVGKAWVFVKPFAAVACGGFLEAKPGKPNFGVEESASNGGMRNLLRFGGGKVEPRQVMFVRLDKSMLDKGGELALEPRMCHERYLDGYVGGWRYVVLVGEGILELVESHGSVWFFNVLS